MNKRLSDCLQNKYDNYIMPFFWQHGAPENTLREYMGKIQNCGIRAVCLEARPHPDFTGKRWFRDVDIIMDEARKRNMRVWILDDSHFPTGYANGAMEHAPNQLKRWFLMEHSMEVDGPLQGCRFEVATHLGYSILFGKKSQYQSEELVEVILAERQVCKDKVFYRNLKNVSKQVRDGWLYTDIPEGNYCIFTYTKKIGAAAKASDHISFLEKDSVKYLIDAVYEPHYEHYKEDFGNTFAGFFSDEPGFYNLSDNPFGMAKIGDHMPLPWSDGVKTLFCRRMADSDAVTLVGLFHLLENNIQSQVRFVYMDIITHMYEENFSKQLGNWCEERGVEYIGHVLEDCGLHSRLGPGTGHYFRAMAGQHMAGIDVVLNQLLPGHDYDRGEFYHYGLAVLAASAAHQNVRMKGRAMCEIFGAFGWSEGLTLMRWMANHMLVNGINWYVPHAFSEKEFPDPDCPPHFYAHGFNPQYRYMYILFEYMNRACHLLNGGQAMVDVAVLFPAEGEWCGNYQPYERMGKICLRHQIPYEVICMDTLKESQIKDGKICIGSAAYKVLLVDGIEKLPGEYIEVLIRLSQQGAKIIFADRIPESIDNKGEIRGKLKETKILSAEEIAEYLLLNAHYQVDKFCKWLRFYEYRHEDLTIYMLFNESMTERICFRMKLPLAESMIAYNPLDNTYYSLEQSGAGGIEIALDKGEAVFILAGDDVSLPEADTGLLWDTEINLQEPCRISLADYRNQDEFIFLDEMTVLSDIALRKKDFSGIIRYESCFTGTIQAIRLDCCYEAAQVWINGQTAGVCIGYPYIYPVKALCNEGRNELRIEVATTLGNSQMDELSLKRPVEPQGILGNITLLK